MDIHDAIDIMLTGDRKIMVLDGNEAVIVTDRGSRVRVYTGEIVTAALAVMAHRKSIDEAFKDLFKNGRIE